MKPDSCFEMLIDFSMRVVDFSFSMSFRSLAMISIDLTSPHDPLDILRKRTNSFLEDLSWPSAMLFIIDMEARQI